MADRTAPRPDVAALRAALLAADADGHVGCPCCGDPMDPTQVVCWPCWRATDRLTPGFHPHPDGVTVRDGQPGILLDAATIAGWDRARAVRVGDPTLAAWEPTVGHVTATGVRCADCGPVPGSAPLTRRDVGGPVPCETGCGRTVAP